MLRILIICGLLFSITAAGQETDSIEILPPHENATTLKARLRQLQDYLDNKARSKVDPRFIEVPEKPWRVILRYKVNEVDVESDNRTDVADTEEYMEWKLRFKPPMASSIGFWVGYRGTGLSYSFSLNKNAGRYFSISCTGAKYGFNFRLRRFNTDKTSFSAVGYNADGTVDGEPLQTEGRMPSPVWIRSVYLNGYYVFNGRRYSQAAAYNQSVIQRRSAGSFLAGATWYQSSFDYSNDDNAFFMFIGHGTHRIKVHQANLGIGYGYNFVPFKGFVINAMVMPTLSVYNRVKVYKYDFNYDFSSGDGETDDYGEWNPTTRTWANGKTHKPLGLLGDDDDDWYYAADFWDNGSETQYSALKLNVDVRLGIAYNWKNYFIGLQAQLNQFSYKQDHNKIRLYDGYARVAVGMRL